MTSLFTRGRVRRLAGFASAQVGVQALGFASGIVLVRHMDTAQYGYYTLAITMVGVASVLTELGIATGVLALGGRLAGEARALAALVGDAHRLHRWLAGAALCLVLPAFAALLLHQHAGPLQTVLLAAIGGASALLTVRTAIALSVARLAGHLVLQQRVDLALNALRLVVLLLVAQVALDATVASLVNLGMAAGAYLAWRRYLARELGVLPPLPGAQRRALRDVVLRQAPNSLYFVLSSQLTVWLVGMFGTADRVADVGALGRLGVAFAVVASVMGAVIQPYFARHHEPAELESGFVALNAFFAAVLALLGAAATFHPAPILWILGPHYAGLQAELVWMVLATGLSAWAGALYTIGCGRGWVLPGLLGIGGGLAATVLGLRLFDVATVAGNYKLATLTAGVALAVNFGYLARCLARHRSEPLPALGQVSGP